MNSNVILVFFLALLILSGCDSKTAEAEVFNSENRVVTNSNIIKAQLSAYSKSHLDLADVYVLTLQIGDETIKVTSLRYIERSSKLNASRTFFTFTKPKNYLIFYSYDAAAKQGNEMRIPTDSLKAGQFTDFPVLDEKTGKMISTRIELLKIQHKS